jgi:hypothetical protein
MGCTCWQLPPIEDFVVPRTWTSSSAATVIFAQDADADATEDCVPFLAEVGDESRAAVLRQYRTVQCCVVVATR